MRRTQFIRCLPQILRELPDLDPAPLRRARRRHEVRRPDTRLHLAINEVPAASHFIWIHQRNGYHTHPTLELGIRIRYRRRTFGVRVSVLRFDGNAMPIDEALDVDPAAIRLRLFLAHNDPCVLEQVAKSGIQWQFVGHCLITLYQKGMQCIRHLDVS